MGNIETEVALALGEIIDPETGLSIMRMDLIHDLAVERGGSVSLVFRPSSPVCPMAYALANSIKKKIESLEQVTFVKIKVENFEKAEHLESLLRSPRTDAAGKEH
ncbi:MAG: iron-sulfur cluster assembly protein [Desulfomonile tiedjei]|uniref:Iron-sulfur cluster assembly protein n=1 Tax=Desulfomonile tiedjei TaxID=2358 RepID=A0A9D6Z611_9BACT|nr:iron-sulfur cluster assembly protein [Desulfomonile tiedjei]